MRASAVAAESVLEFFPALRDLGLVRHAFIGRIPGIDVALDRSAALARLDTAHHDLRNDLDLGGSRFATAEQVHGREIAVLDEPLCAGCCVAGADGLVTNQTGISLGTYVADCCAVFLVDPVRRCIGLVHSGKKGTELAIVVRAIETLRERFGSAPGDLVVQLGPCIRPPHYEVDFAADIIRQARAAGVRQVYDSGRCTACDLQRYYSYRAEKARTGRMLALLALRPFD
ncbi:MAG: polyphenol oxidase family protein [Chthoniobacterales bacterium]|nr:polyphenol oxidase family protein [Chthoniobacterales bacterium]